MTRQKLIVAAALLAGAALAAFVEYGPRNSTPTPGGEFSLRGKWIGRVALEVDGAKQQPRITTGVQMEDIRIAAAEGRFLPRKLTQDQPHAVAAAGRYLDEHAGTSGGPLDADSRAKWVKSLRDLAQLAEESIR